MDKYKSSFLSNCYDSLFTDEERRPLAYIIAIFVAVIISLTVALFIVAVDRHLNGWVQYMFN